MLVVQLDRLLLIRRIGRQMFGIRSIQWNHTRQIPNCSVQQGESPSYWMYNIGKFVIDTGNILMLQILHFYSNNRKTFSSFRYMVVPIYWNGQTGESERMDKTALSFNVDKAVNNLMAGSWGKLKLTYDIVEQTEHILSSPSRINQASWGAEDILTKLGYKKNVDYDGIILIYNTLGGNGAFCCNGGQANLGGTFATVSYSTSNWTIIRHEIGRK
jgi:hypothetical protein